MSSKVSSNHKAAAFSIMVLASLASLSGHGMSCLPEDRKLELAEYIFSYVPMTGALDLEADVATHTGDVGRVYKGNLNVQENVVSSLPGVLPLGEEFIIAAYTKRNGKIEIGPCTLVIDEYKNADWASRTLGSPLYEFSPRIYEPRSPH